MSPWVPWNFETISREQKKHYQNLGARKSRSENVSGKIVDIIWFIDSLRNYGRSAHVYKTQFFWLVILIVPFVPARIVSGGMGRWVTAQHTMTRPKNGEEGGDGRENGNYCWCAGRQCRANTSWRLLPWPIANDRLANRLDRLFHAMPLLLYTPVAPFISVAQKDQKIRFD